MLQLSHQSFNLEFEHPFTTSKGTKTHLYTLVTQLKMGNMTGYGEAPEIDYHNTTVAGMMALLEEKRSLIERYSMTDPKRFWHFLHHLIPGQHFLICALDIAGWDLFGKMRRQPLYKVFGVKYENTPICDYTIGSDCIENMVAKLKAHPWPLYKIKVTSGDDIDILRALREHTQSPFRIDGNEGLSFDDMKHMLPDLQKLGVNLIEQPLPDAEMDAMKELKALSPITLIADESCQELKDVARCAEGFDGINIKLTKCGGITPALEMIQAARKLGLKVMMGSMCEGVIGSSAMAHLSPMLDEIDADGPLLLKEDIAGGLTYHKDGKMSVSEESGLGINYWNEKRTVARDW